MRWHDAAPSIVAESLCVAADPPAPAQELSTAPAATVAASLARLACPRLAADIPPPWLRPAQVEPWRRVVSAVREFRGALLAEPPGTGKTWIALAAALALTRRPVACLVPAVVQSQWRAVAARIGVPISIGTHEQASRGRLPPCHDLVIVDESHHYRNATIKRYPYVARWLAGQQAILLSGTPVVNRLDDLLHQLSLVIRDDALALHGLPSLRALGQRPEFPEAISRIVVRSAPSATLPNQRTRTVRFRLGLRVSHVLRAIRALDISPDRGVRALVRGVLMRAAASSPAALAGALRRYGFLLANHADAVQSGCMVSRDDLRRWAGAGGEQTVMWAVVSEGGESAHLCPDDAVRVRALLALLAEITPADDPKAALLANLLADGRRTLVFATSRESVAWLRRALGYHRTAWCTGDGAGIGMARRPRDEVLRLFGPEAREQAPAVLVSTDLAAEGLDLQRAERVVHYDLPWTPARLEQRVGRAARLGAAVAEVEVVRFDPPRLIERAIHSVRILREKADLPERARLVNVGLGGWPEVVASAGAGATASGGIAWIADTTRHGILAGLEITGFDEQGRLVSGGRLLWVDAEGWSDRLPDLTGPLLEALAAREGPRPGARILRTARASVDKAVNQLLTVLNGSVWERSRRPELAALIERLRHVRRRAVEQRDAATAGLVSNVLRLAASGRTAGETLLLKELGRTTGRPALRAMALLPRARPVQRFEVRVAGVVVFGDGWTAGRLGGQAARRQGGKAARGQALAVQPSSRPAVYISPMPQLSTVLFDLDGTIIDSVRLIIDSYHHTLRTHGLPARTDEEWLAGIGTPLRVQFAEWAEHPGIEEMIATYRDYNLTHHDSRVLAYPGVADMVRGIRAMGLRTGLVTSKNRSGAERGLRVAGLAGTMEVIIGADDVENPKPHPEPVFRAMDHLGVSAGETIYVGDSVHDMQAGRAAGVRTAAVLWGPFARPHLEPALPDHWLERPDQLLQLARTLAPTALCN